MNSQLANAGLSGNFGDRDHIEIEGQRYNLQEAQGVKNNWASWRSYLYNFSTQRFNLLDIRTHGSSSAFANPTISAITSPSGKQALALTFFIPSEGAASGEAGELIFFKEFNNQNSGTTASSQALQNPVREQAAPAARGCDERDGGCVGSPQGFPTHVRIANSQQSLDFAQEQLFNMNGKVIDWTLPNENGQKTVYAQFKVNGIWQSPISATITLSLPVSTTPTPRAGNSFQPAAPYYATFYYPWFAKPDLGGNWGHWQGDNNQHNPPKNWFSNYLPDFDTTKFDPVNELYSFWDGRVFYWQLQKMAEAKIEVAIFSWWGKDNTFNTDRAFNLLVGDIMNRSDNPYPNLKWAIYYEKEGSSDPTSDEIAQDLTYIKDKYTSQPSYLKIDGKPVIFVYNEIPGDGVETTDRWVQARNQTGFYVVAKTYPEWEQDATKLDSWHTYDTLSREALDPGYWKSGGTPQLTRDLSMFRTAVTDMVNANVTWKLVETWNEYGEGTGVEPADQVIQATGNATAVLDPNGTPFKNRYVDILNQLLPSLEQGTGGCILTSPSNLQPNGNVSPGSKIITWNSTCGTRYMFRIDDYSNGWVGDCSKTQNSGDVCDENLTTNSYQYNFQAGHTYHIWVHAANSFGIVTNSTETNVTVANTPTSTPKAFSCTPCAVDIAGKRDTKGSNIPDGFVNGWDFSQMIGCRNKKSSDKNWVTCQKMDINGNGAIDDTDWNTWIKCVPKVYNKQCLR